MMHNVNPFIHSHIQSFNLLYKAILFCHFHTLSPFVVFKMMSAKLTTLLDTIWCFSATFAAIFDPPRLEAPFSSCVLFSLGLRNFRTGVSIFLYMGTYKILPILVDFI